MLFNSTEFLFLFLPAVVAVFYTVKRLSPRSTILVIGGLSVIFYWNGGANNVLVPVGSIIFNYAIASAWERIASVGLRKYLIAIGVAGNLLLLVYFKYINFFADQTLALFDREFDALQIILPLAISFFTFQQISFLLDLHGGRIKRPRFFEYFAYVSFFPQLIAGPIVRFDEIHSQFIRAGASRNLGVVWSNLSVGLTIFAFGLIKKVVLADTMAQFADPVFYLAQSGDILTTPDAWIGMTAFSFQLYFDFAGYSDMAVGLARMVGFRLPINFNSPFKSRDIADFWRRWHMTLTRLVTDYLYTPLSLSFTRKAVGWNLSASGVALVGMAIPVVITFALLGLWHGAGWNFLVFGLFHAAYLILLRLWIRGRAIFNLPKLPATFASLLTFFCVALSFVMFRSDSVNSAMSIYGALVAWNGLFIPDGLASLIGLSGAVLERFAVSAIASPAWQGTNAVVWLALCAVITFATPNVYEVMYRYRPALYKGWTSKLQPFGNRQGSGDAPLASGRPTVALVGAATGLCVLAFFQGVDTFSALLPTFVTMAAGALLLAAAVWQMGKPPRYLMWRLNTAWLLTTSMLLAVGILDVFTDSGVEFVYFEF